MELWLERFKKITELGKEFAEYENPIITIKNDNNIEIIKNLV